MRTRLPCTKLFITGGLALREVEIEIVWEAEKDVREASRYA